MQIYFAPMEGVTGYILRNAYQRHFGCIDKYFTPFIPAAKRLSAKIKRDINPDNNPGIRLVPQLISNQSQEVLDMIEQLKDYGYREFNINLGCPSGTVVSKKRGSGLLLYPEELERFLEGIYERVDVPVSVKTRIGFQDLAEWPRLLEIYSRYPLAELIIHPRLRKEQYGGFVHLDAFRRAYDTYCPAEIDTHFGSTADCRFPANVLLAGSEEDSPASASLITARSSMIDSGMSRTVLCYNGDLWNLECFRNITDQFPALNTVMIGRGLLAHPTLSCSIKGKPLSDPRRSLRSFLDEIYDQYLSIFDGEKDVVMHMKEIWCNLKMSFQDSDRLAKKILKSQTGSEYRALVDQVFDTLELVDD